MSLTPDQLIPPGDELAHLLESLGDKSDDTIWKISNLTNDLIEEVKQVAKKDDVYRAVSARTKGRQKDTIRRWAECAADFDREAQRKYAGLLSFEHFKVARRLTSQELAPDPIFVLEWAITTYSSRFATVDEVLANFLKQTGETTGTLFWNKIKDRLNEEIGNLNSGEDKHDASSAFGTLNRVFGKEG